MVPIKKKPTVVSFRVIDRCPWCNQYVDFKRKFSRIRSRAIMGNLDINCSKCATIYSISYRIRGKDIKFYSLYVAYRDTFLGETNGRIRNKNL
jgi:hypothetical protein